MTHRSPLRIACLLVALAAPLALHADPLHPLAGDAFWHHDSNFIYPATLAGFERIGAPQDVDGSTTINAHYRGDANERSLIVSIDLFPRGDGAADFSGAKSIESIDLGAGRGLAQRARFPGSIGEVLYSLEHGGWRMLIRARLREESDAARVDQLVRALPIERLGTVDARCPNPGCGT